MARDSWPLLTNYTNNFFDTTQIHSKLTKSILLSLWTLWSFPVVVENQINESVTIRVALNNWEAIFGGGPD